MESKSPLLKQAWDKFQASAESARQIVETCPRFDHPANRAQGYYALMEAQAMAYTWVIAPRLNHPRIFTHTIWATYLFTIAGNCPDFVYKMLAVDGRYTYRIRGRFGDMRLLLIQVLNLPMGVEGSRCTGNFEYAKEDSDDFEIVLSATKQPGNWIPIDPTSDYNMLVIRQLMLDWEENPGKLEVEMIGELESYDELSEVAIARRIGMAADFMQAVISRWAIGLIDLTLQLTQGLPNVWGPIPGQMMVNIAGSATCNYAFLMWNLQPDEALIIEFQPPVGSAYWSFQLVDVWCKSLDFMHEQTDFNMRNAAVDADGKVRAVISYIDPGVANWLNPIGRPQGLCALRNYHSESFSNPTARLVKFSELDAELPADTIHVTAESRRRSVARRRPAILDLYRG